MREITCGCLCIGEPLVDFCQIGTKASGYPIYEAKPGGAPASRRRFGARGLLRIHR